MFILYTEDLIRVGILYGIDEMTQSVKICLTYGSLK